MRYLFIGPDEKHFDSKKSNKIKKLVSLLFDYEYSVTPAKERTLEVVLKPSTGFTTVIANAILDYRKNNPDKPIRVSLATEFSTDFAELPEKTQELFKSLGVSNINYVVSVGIDADGKQSSKTGSKTAYSGMLAYGTPVYYYDPNVKIDKVFEKECKYIEESRQEKINLYDNFNGEAYSKDGVRKKANGLTYSYRINTTLPNNKKFSEEYSNFVTIYHARTTRIRRLVKAMWQDVEPNPITLTELFNEYIETKGNTPALQTKYKQYHSAFIVGRKLGEQKVQGFAEHKPDLSYFRVHFRDLAARFATDSRYKEDGYYDENEKWHYRVLTDEYKQGYFAFLNDLFKYAYLKGYIPYQPLLLFDISKL